MKKLIIAILLFLSVNANAASVQVSDATNYITVTVDGVVKWTIPKRDTDIEIYGTKIRLRYSTKYVVEFQYSDVTSPGTANIEALRVAIKNMLINI